MRLLGVLLLVGIVVGVGALVAASEDPESHVLARFETPLEGRTISQRHNARLSVEALNGAVIDPHGEFSFNKTVGGWSKDMGYVKAPVSFNGALVDDWGGGVCQTSTTLYNAALLGGFEVVERSRHRFAPGYCPPGRDAAVAFGGIDLKLKNPYDFRVSIRAEMKRSGLVVSLIGPKKVDRKVLLSSEIVRFVSPREYKIEGSGPVNRVRNSGKPGYEVMTYRTIDGRQELVSVDSYPPFHRILETKGR